MQSFFKRIVRCILILTVMVESVTYGNTDVEEERYLPPKESVIQLDNFLWNKESIEEVQGVIQNCGNGISVFYKDIQSGYTYIYNERQKYFIASIIKAPYCMYIYDLASQGKCDLNKTYIYADRHTAEGTGKIKEMSIGTVFTLRQLLEYCIKYSDNVAMNIIRENFPVSGYKEYAKEIGLRYIEDIKYATNGDIRVSEAGIYIEAIYNFIEQNTYGPELRQLMLSTTNPMIISTYPVVRKYGWANQSFHDIAIVEGPRPYLLCILTNHDGDFISFRKISQIIEKQVINNYIEAKPSPYQIIVNNQSKDIVGYDINGSTYLSIRQIAEVINATASRFSITWDKNKSAIIINIGEMYQSSVKVTNQKISSNAIPIESRIYIDGKEVILSTYNINGTTYFKLRDLGELIKIQINWLKDKKCISIVA